jgi:cystathionine beta-lyase
MYNFDEIIERRGTQSLKWDSEGKDLLHMWVADMDFRAPPPVLEALRKRIEHGVFGYGIAGGLPGIIRRWMREEFGTQIEEDWITLLCGIVPVLRAASHLRPGPVLIQTPNYNALLDAPLTAGKETILSPLRNTDEKYVMDFDDMARRVTGETRLFYLCNPHNPVGRVYTKDELLELSRFAKEHGLIVVSDEVHCGLTFDRAHIPWFSVDDYAAEQGITLIGPAKTFNIPGLPLGFALIPNEALRAEFREICHALPGPGVFSVIAAEAALGESREWKNAAVEYLRLNRDYLENRLRGAFPKARLPHTEGTYLQWIDFRPQGIEEPFRWLRERPKILVSDGKIYGAEGYVRINFGAPRSRLEEAVDRIEECAKEIISK